MEECCIVCAEPLEWIAYGPCNHKEVCSMCTARLRFVVKDKKCCICKQEQELVFVTKALGAYTKPVADFSSLKDRISKPNGHGDLWYDRDIEAYFDDKEHFDSIQAMNKLSCSICENNQENPNKPPLSSAMGILPRGFTFKDVTGLKTHYEKAHKVEMCSVCLEGLKIFVSQQKLYSRAELRKHCESGTANVDGTAEERGGFHGHSYCQFCKKWFYGDNELYIHMKHDHYDCFLCAKSRPNNHEYYKSYGDLESHFRNEHFLCEDEGCLASKFKAFASEQDLKRHSVQEHSGHMSRSERQRNLQVPASQFFNFSLRMGGQDGNRADGGSRQRDRGGSRNSGGPGPSTQREMTELQAALQESLVIGNRERPATPPPPSVSQPVREPPPAPPPPEAFPSLNGEISTPFRLGVAGYASSVTRDGPALDEGFFPPLPTAANPKGKARATDSKASMAARVRRGSNLPVSGAGRPRLFPNGNPQGKSLAAQSVGPGPSSVGNHGKTLGPVGGANVLSGVAGPSASTALLPHNRSNVSGVGNREEELRRENKALIENIRTALAGNEEQFADFKRISAAFRQDKLSSQNYYSEISRLGLSHLVPDLAKLCPDPLKSKELLAAHNAVLSFVRNGQAGPSTVNPAVLIPDRGSSSGQQLRNGEQRQDGNKQQRQTPSDSSLTAVVSSSGNSESGKKVRKEKQLRPAPSGVAVNGGGSSGQSAAGDPLPAAGPSTIGRTPSSTSLSDQNSTSNKPSSVDLSDGEEDGNTWCCGVCTLRNSEEAKNCAACMSGRPSKSAGSSTSVKKKKVKKFQRLRLGEFVTPSDFEPPGESSQVGPPQPGVPRGAWRGAGGRRLL